MMGFLIAGFIFELLMLCNALFYFAMDGVIYMPNDLIEFVPSWEICSYIYLGSFLVVVSSLLVDGVKEQILT